MGGCGRATCDTQIFGLGLRPTTVRKDVAPTRSGHRSGRVLSSPRPHMCGLSENSGVALTSAGWSSGGR